MKGILNILPFAAVFILYRFNPIAGLIALVLLSAAFLVIKRPTILMLRGNSKYNKGDREGGLALMEKAYKTGKLDSTMTVFYSYRLLSENKDAEAEAVLDEYINGGKGSAADIARAKHNKAIILRKAGRLDEAFALMKEVHSEIPATDTYGTLGLIYTDMMKTHPELGDEALEFAENAYEYNSDDKNIASNLGEMYMYKGETDKAEEIYQRLVSSKQAGPTAYYNYARALMQKERYDDAEDMLNHALRYSFTGVTAIKRDDVVAALKELEDRQR